MKFIFSKRVVQFEELAHDLTGGNVFRRNAIRTPFAALFPQATTQARIFGQNASYPLKFSLLLCVVFARCLEFFYENMLARSSFFA